MRSNLIIAASVVVVLVIAAGFFALSTNQSADQTRNDITRVRNLQALVKAIDEYSEEYREAPENLSKLVSFVQSNSYYSYNEYWSITDPVTGEEYSYTPGNRGEYELCAVFEEAYVPESDWYLYFDDSVDYTIDPFAVGGAENKVRFQGNRPTDFSNQPWYYEPGEQCFTRTTRFNPGWLNVEPTFAPLPSLDL